MKSTRAIFGATMVLLVGSTILVWAPPIETAQADNNYACGGPFWLAKWPPVPPDPPSTWCLLYGTTNLIQACNPPFGEWQDDPYCDGWRLKTLHEDYLGLYVDNGHFRACNDVNGLPPNYSRSCTGWELPPFQEPTPTEGPETVQIAVTYLDHLVTCNQVGGPPLDYPPYCEEWVVDNPSDELRSFLSLMAEFNDCNRDETEPDGCDGLRLA